MAVPGFDDVVATMGPPLWRLTSAYARGHPEREDLYQEILVAVWKALPRFRGDASLRTFVFRIGHNRGLTHRARMAARRGRETDVTEDLRDPRPATDDALHEHRRRDRLVAAIGSLSPTLAQPVMLSLEGLSYAEIADVLGITESNVGVRLNRARAALRRLLKQEEIA